MYFYVGDWHGFVSLGPPGLSSLNALKFIYLPPKVSKKEHHIWPTMSKAFFSLHRSLHKRALEAGTHQSLQSRHSPIPLCMGHGRGGVQREGIKSCWIQMVSSFLFKVSLEVFPLGDSLYLESLISCIQCSKKKKACNLHLLEKNILFLSLGPWKPSRNQG